MRPRRPTHWPAAWASHPSPARCHRRRIPVVPAGRLLERAQALGEIIAQQSPAATRASKKAIWESLNMGLEQANQHGWDAVRAFWNHPDYLEGPRAFAQKRPPKWTE